MQQGRIERQHHLSENHMLAVQPWRWSHRDKNCRTRKASVKFYSAQDLELIRVAISDQAVFEACY